MDNLIPSFSDSLFDPTIEIGKDALELGIDAVLEDGLLKDIPIVGTITSLGKIYVNIRERNFLKQTLAFLYEFKSREMDADKLKEHNKKLGENKALFEKELGMVLVYLDKNTEVFKSKLDAKLYVAFLNEEISFDDFCEYMEITNRIFLSDLSILKAVYQDNGVNQGIEVSYRHERLISLGLMGNRTRLTGVQSWADLGGKDPKMIEMTDLGRTYCKYIFI